MKKSIALIVVTAFLFAACKKDESKSLPTLETLEVAEIGSSSASSGGKQIISAADITEKGLYWSSTNSTPGIGDSKISNGSGNGGYKSVMTGLLPGTSYYVRAYATNKYGTGYGNTRSFTALSSVTVTTYDFDQITTSSMKVGGEILNSGSRVIRNQGICWSTAHNPTIHDHFTGFAVNPFSQIVSGLASNTTYYVRAVMISDVDTVYGSEAGIKTYYGSVGDYDAHLYNTIKIGSQEWMVENLASTHFRNGADAQGLVYYYEWDTITRSAYSDLSSTTFHGLDYGRVYNWYTINDARNIAPQGWHVATQSDWQTLINYVGADSAAYKLRLYDKTQTYWNSANGSNSAGFCALGVGYLGTSRDYSDLKQSANFWLKDVTPRIAVVSLNSAVVQITSLGSKNYGCSIRCVKD